MAGNRVSEEDKFMKHRTTRKTDERAGEGA
jgi:hypothetical protein